MIVVVHLADQRRARTDSHGIINFSLGLVRALPEALGPDDRLVVQVNDEMVEELGDGFLRPGDELDVVAAPRHGLARLWLDHVGVSRLARSRRADVVLYPKGFMPVSRRLVRARHVVCLHDDIPALGAAGPGVSRAKRLKAAYFTWLLRRSMRAADRRLFVSRFSERSLTRRWSGPRRDDAVINEGISLPRLPLAPLDGRLRQAVMLGSTHAHKRTAAGLALVGADPALAAHLDRVVVVGPLVPPVDRVGDLPVEHVPGPISSRELAELIARSRLLVYPSEYEGFGLPPIEAFALGTPAVFRLNEAAAEVLPGVPGGYDEETATSFGAAVAEALSLDDAALGELSAGMWDRFDWQVVASRVVAALGPGRP